MNLKEYQQEAIKTVNPALSKEEVREMCWFGLVGEIGEVFDLHKKERFHKKEVHWPDYRKEFGDVLWYIAALANAHGIELKANEELANLIDGASMLPATELLWKMRSAIEKAIYWSDTKQPQPNIIQWNLIRAIADLGALARVYWSTLDEIAETNIAKLRARHGESWSHGNYNSKAEG